LPLLQKQRLQFEKLVAGDDFVCEMSALTAELDKLLVLVEKTRPTLGLQSNLRVGVAEVHKSERGDYIRGMVEKQVAKIKGRSVMQEEGGSWVKHIDDGVLEELQASDSMCLINNG